MLLLIDSYNNPREHANTNTLSVSTITIPATSHHTNKFKQGVQWDYADWKQVNPTYNSDYQLYRNFITQSGAGYIRIMPYRQDNAFPKGIVNGWNTGPCSNWNSVTHTGTFDWVNMDWIVNEIRALGAEPIICLLHASETVPFPQLPKGMATASNGLPDPVDWGYYCAAWVKHYGSQVKYYEIFNEPYVYWDWNENMAKVANLMALYKQAYDRMHSASASVMISFDSCKMRNVTDYMLSHRMTVDWIDFHSYPAQKLSDTMSYIIGATPWEFYGSTNLYSIELARTKFGNKPVILSEANFNSAWSGGTDPRNNQIEGVCIDAMQISYALKLDMAGRVHYFFSNNPTSGFGFINRGTDTALKPFNFYKLINTYLNLSDPVHLATSTNSNLQTVAWRHNSDEFLLIINKSKTPVTLNTLNTSGHIDFINETHDAIQTQDMGSHTLNAYSIALYRTN